MVGASARNRGIDHPSAEKVASRAACCTPFLYIRKVGVVFISRKTITSSYKKVIEIGSTSGIYRWLEIALARHIVIIKVFVLYIAVCYTLLVEKIDMSKRDRCGSIATLE